MDFREMQALFCITVLSLLWPGTGHYSPDSQGAQPTLVSENCSASTGKNPHFVLLFSFYFVFNLQKPFYLL